MPNYLDVNFGNDWWRADSMDDELSTGEWMVAMRIGKHIGYWGDAYFDYHYWYRTDDGRWAHKRGGRLK